MASIITGNPVYDIALNAFGGLSKSKDRARRGREYDQQLAAITTDTGEYAFDPQGYLPTIPGRRVARQAQYATEAYIARRNAAVRRDALNALRSGLSILGSYRPGGAAMLTSPFYSQQAQVLMNSQLDVPDQLAMVRKAAMDTSRKLARRAGYIKLAGAVLGGAANLAAPGAGAVVSGLANQYAGGMENEAALAAQGAQEAPGSPQTPFSFQGGGQTAPAGLGEQGAPQAPLGTPADWQQYQQGIQQAFPAAGAPTPPPVETGRAAQPTGGAGGVLPGGAPAGGGGAGQVQGAGAGGGQAMAPGMGPAPMDRQQLAMARVGTNPSVDQDLVVYDQMLGLADDGFWEDHLNDTIDIGDTISALVY